MKKSLTRVLSLVLVLVMMLGVMPVASAATGSISVGDNTLTVGESTTVRANVSLNQYEYGYNLNQATYTWSGNGATAAGTGSSFTFEAAAAGTYTINLSVSIPVSWGGGQPMTVNCGSKTIEVTAPAAPVAVTGVTIKKGGTATTAFSMDVDDSNVTLTASVAPDNATQTVTWASSNTSVATVNNGVVHPVSAGTTKITATSTADNTKKAECTVTVHDYSVTVTPATLTLAPGAQNVALTVDVKDGSAAVNNATVTWSGEANGIEVMDNKVFVSESAAANASATLKATAKIGSKTLGEDTCVVTVADNVVTATLSAASMTLKVGEEKALPTITYSPALTGVTPTVVWSSSAPAKASVDNDTDKVTGEEAGEATLTAAIEIEGYTVNAPTCAVTVETGDVALTCDNESAEVGSTVTLAPTLKIGGVAATNVKYKFTAVSGSSSLTATPTTASDKASATIKSNSDGIVVVKVEVEEYKLGDATITATGDAAIDPINVSVRFYDNHTMELTLIDGKTFIEFGDTNVFSKVVVNDSVKNATVTKYSVKDLLNYVLPSDSTTPSRVTFSTPASSSAGELVDGYGSDVTSQSWINISKVVFRQVGTRTGTTGFSFKILDSNGLTMAQGVCRITIVGGEGDIHYETTYNKAVTLKLSDFLKYWEDCDLPTQYKLEYVKFDDPSTLEGTLYTDSTKKTLVTSSMKFYVDPTSSQYDLDDVYYVPLKTKTTEYIDSVNFTAVDNYGAKAQSGSVTFGLNTKSRDITSRGIIFGSTYAEEIYDTYKANTGKTLGYVVFALPKANDGKMVSSVPTPAGSRYASFAKATMLERGDKLWLDPGSKELSLKEAGFVPAAGFKGEVVLSYTAYDVNGNNDYAGVLRLNVTEKTKSECFNDVTVKNYSWASDSVDFLYYEGTAQGSNGKYNPSANITRRDFMLMLYRAFLAEDYGTFTVTSNFPDVVKGADSYSKEIYQAVGVAKYLGIAQGTNNKFNPTSNITRQEAMVLIYRTLDKLDKDLDYLSGTSYTSLKDYSKVASWAKDAIADLVYHGVIKGNNDNIKPLDPISRAEMAAILHRVITY